MMMYKHIKIAGGMLLGCFLIWSVLIEQTPVLIDSALAQVNPIPAATGLNDLLEKTGVFFDVLMVAVYGAIHFLSALLSPDLMVDLRDNILIGNNGKPLIQFMWAFSRNIVNVIFAFLLIIVALTITVTGGTSAPSKDKMVKFVVALILVNFSWFFAWVIYDVGNVLTATVYSLAASVPGECMTITENGDLEEGCLYIQNAYLFPDRTDACVVNAASNPDRFHAWGGIFCLELGDLPDDTNTGMGMLQGMYLNFVQLINVGRVVNAPLPGAGGGGWSQVQTLSRFVAQFFLVFGYVIIAGLPILAMAAAFFVRIPIIMITIMAMPFIFISFVIGEKFVDTMDIFKHFLKAVFLPTVIAVPLSIGFIILRTGMAANCNAITSQPWLCNEMGGLRIGGLKSWWQLFWALTGIFIMWVGTFMTFSKMGGVFAMIGGAFDAVGKNWGKFALKAPLSLPVVPMPRGGQASIMQLGRLAQNPNLMIGPNNTLTIDSIRNATRGGGTAVNRTLADPTIKTELGRIRDAIQNNSPPDYRVLAQHLNQNHRGVDIRAVLERSPELNATNGMVSQKSLDEIVTEIRAAMPPNP